MQNAPLHFRPSISKRALAGGLAAGASAAGGQAEFERFGGWTGLRFEKTGFFRLERRRRWWFVTPEGNAFLVFGINHAGAELLRQPCNRDYWLKSFGASNAQEPLFLEGFRRRVEADMEAFGFNSFGCHTSTRPWKPNRYPYIHPFTTVRIHHHDTPADADFQDVFAPGFAALCERRATEEDLATLARDPFLIGYSFTDCPIWSELEAASRQVVVYGAPRAATSAWPRVLRNLPATAPGEQAYAGLRKRRYGDIAALNRAYERKFNSFDHLAGAVNWRPAADPLNAAEASDNEAFLLEILERYYATMAATVRRFDPHHLIPGDKLNGNTGTPASVAQVAAKHTDAIFYQWYAYYGEQKSRLDEWSRATGKPLLNGDSTYSVPSREMPRPLGPHCATAEERARRLNEFARCAYSRPDFVGRDVCGWMDGWNAIPGREVRRHGGMQDPFGRRDEHAVRVLKRFSQQMYGLVADAC